MFGNYDVKSQNKTLNSLFFQKLNFNLVMIIKLASKAEVSLIKSNSHFRSNLVSKFKDIFKIRIPQTHDKLNYPRSFVISFLVNFETQLLCIPVSFRKVNWEYPHELLNDIDYIKLIPFKISNSKSHLPLFCSLRT